MSSLCKDTISTNSVSTPFYDPRIGEQTYHRFIYYLPIVSILVKIFGYLVLVSLLIPDAIKELSNLGTLPPQQKVDFRNDWNFPNFYLCIGHPRNAVIDSSYQLGCDTFYPSGDNASLAFPCSLTNQSFDFHVFSQEDELIDECFVVNVTDQMEYNTTLTTSFSVRQNMKLPVVTSASDFPRWLLHTPSTVMGTFLDPRNDMKVQRTNFMVFPCTSKMTVLIMEEVEDETQEFDASNLAASLTKEVSSSIGPVSGATGGRFTYKYSIFSGGVGKYGNGALCFPHNATHEDCSTHFEMDVRIRTLGDYRLRHSTISSQPHWRTWLGSFAGKFSLGHTLIFVLVLVLETLILRYCFNQKSDRDTNVDLFNRLKRLQERRVTKLTDNEDLQMEMMDSTVIGDDQSKKVTGSKRQEDNKQV